MGGYPPGLPPLQGPVDGLVSMGSMQPLHPGGPPPHHLPPGVPGLPGIPPPGKNIILIHSLISFFNILFPPSATSSRGHLLPMVARLPSLRIPELSAVGPILHLSRWPTTTCALVYLAAAQDALQRSDLYRSRSRRHGSLSDTCLKSFEGHNLSSMNCQSRVIYKITFYSKCISSSAEILISQGLLCRVPHLYHLFLLHSPFKVITE